MPYLLKGDNRDMEWRITLMDIRILAFAPPENLRLCFLLLPLLFSSKGGMSEDKPLLGICFAQGVLTFLGFGGKTSIIDF